MEIHVVHENAPGKSVVVGVLFKKGKANKAFAPLFDNAPNEVSDTPKTIEGKTIDLAALLPARRGYVRYEGSLTTPPCTEGLTWYVLTTPAEVSEEQVHALQERTHGPTNRPMQPLNARPLLEYRP